MERKEPLIIFSHVHKAGGTSINHHIRRNFRQEQYIHIHYNEANCFYNVNKRKYDILKDYHHLVDYLGSLSEKKAAKVEAIFGHDVFYGIDKYFNRQARYYTFIRHPIARILSYYNYSLTTIKLRDFSPATQNDQWLSSFFVKDTLMSFKEWVLLIKSEPEILTSQFPTLIDHYCLIVNPFISKGISTFDNAKDILGQFYFVGITEQFKDFLFMYEDIGFKKIYSNHNITGKKFVTRDDISFLLQNTPAFLDEDIRFYELGIKLNKEFTETGNYYTEKVENCSNRMNSWLWRKIEAELKTIHNKDDLNIGFDL